MTNPSADFFDELQRRGHEPLLEGAKGVVCVELLDGGRIERRIVAIDRGDIAVPDEGAAADCTLRVPGSIFDDLVGGRANALACVLRGAMNVEGDWALMLLFQRLFPSPPRAGEDRGEGFGENDR
jgi:putative sterol carrier protein